MNEVRRSVTTDIVIASNIWRKVLDNNKLYSNAQTREMVRKRIHLFSVCAKFYVLVFFLKNKLYFIRLDIKKKKSMKSYKKKLTIVCVINIIIYNTKHTNFLITNFKMLLVFFIGDNFLKKLQFS